MSKVALVMRSKHGNTKSGPVVDIGGAFVCSLSLVFPLLLSPSFSFFISSLAFALSVSLSLFLSLFLSVLVCKFKVNLKVRQSSETFSCIKVSLLSSPFTHSGRRCRRLGEERLAKRSSNRRR